MNSTSSNGMSIETITFTVNTVFTCVGMLGIGATTNHLQIWKQLRNSKAYILGVTVQMLLVPLVAWAMTAIFQMGIAPSLAVMIQGCAPGGVLSNIIVFYSDGLVDLSIAMTVSTTLLSLGFMPLWLFIFSKYSETRLGATSLAVPFDVIGITVASLLLPILIGMLINVKCPKRAPLVSRILTAVGGLGIVSMVIASVIVTPLPWDQVWNWKNFVVALLMPCVCFSFAWLCSLLPSICGVGFTRQESQTLGVEIALQNVQVGAAVIGNSFNGNIAIYVQMITFPVFYLLWQIGEALIMIGVVRILLKKGCISSNDKMSNEDSDSPQQGGTENPVFKLENS